MLPRLRFYSGAATAKNSVQTLVDGIIEGDRLAISKSITLIESSLPAHERQADELFQLLQGRLGRAERPASIRLGFTGAPGVGKSTLIEAFGMFLVEGLQKRLAVLTVDPSSVRSGGSILGDKTRMPRLSQHPHAYIRSSPNQGDSGGVVGSTFDTIRLCECKTTLSDRLFWICLDANYDIVLVETVGAGQSELAVANLVDIFILIVAPGIGDELQGLKKGITEVADVILVNKADDPHDQPANQAVFEYRSAMRFSLGGQLPKKVLPISGRTGRGIGEAWDAITGLRDTHWACIKGKRQEQEGSWMANMAKQQLVQRFEEFLESIKIKPSLEGQSLRTSACQLLAQYHRVMHRHISK